MADNGGGDRAREGPDAPHYPPTSPQYNADPAPATTYECPICAEDRPIGVGPYSFEQWNAAIEDTREQKYCLECLRQIFQIAVRDPQSFPAHIGDIENDPKDTIIELDIDIYATVLADEEFVSKYRELVLINKVHPPQARLFCQGTYAQRCSEEGSGILGGSRSPEALCGPAFEHDERRPDAADVRPETCNSFLGRRCFPVDDHNYDFVYCNKCLETVSSTCGQPERFCRPPANHDCQYEEGNPMKDMPRHWVQGVEYQFCPGCGVLGYRYQGCNEIKCACKTIYCWICQRVETADRRQERHRDRGECPVFNGLPPWFPLDLLNRIFQADVEETPQDFALTPRVPQAPGAQDVETFGAEACPPILHHDSHFQLILRRRLSVQKYLHANRDRPFDHPADDPDGDIYNLELMVVNLRYVFSCLHNASSEHCTANAESWGLDLVSQLNYFNHCNQLLTHCVFFARHDDVRSNDARLAERLLALTVKFGRLRLDLEAIGGNVEERKTAWRDLYDCVVRLAALWLEDGQRSQELDWNDDTRSILTTMTGLTWSLEKLVKIVGRDLDRLTIWQHGLIRAVLAQVARHLNSIDHDGRARRFCSHHRDCQTVRLLSRKLFDIFYNTPDSLLPDRQLDSDRDADTRTFELLPRHMLAGVNDMRYELSGVLRHGANAADGEQPDDRTRELFSALGPIQATLDLVVSTGSLADLPRVDEDQMKALAESRGRHRFDGGTTGEYGRLTSVFYGIATTAHDLLALILRTDPQ